MKIKIDIFILLFLTILFIAINIAYATTFLPQTLDDLDEKADYVIIGRALSQKSILEDGGRSIATITTVAVDEVLKGSSYPNRILVKEKGGVVGEVMMVVPGSPRFSEGEHIALFFDQEKRSSVPEGHTVGMAQGKFSIVGPEGNEILVNDLNGAQLITQESQQFISLANFRARYKQSFFSRLLAWLEWIIRW